MSDMVNEILKKIDERAEAKKTAQPVDPARDEIDPKGPPKGEKPLHEYGDEFKKFIEDQKKQKRGA